MVGVAMGVDEMQALYEAQRQSDPQALAHVSQPAGPNSQPAAPTSGRAPARTMIGMGIDVAAIKEAAAKIAAEKAAQAAPREQDQTIAGQAPPPEVTPAQSNQASGRAMTMLGMAMPAQAIAEAAQKQKLEAQSNRTMLGMMPGVAARPSNDEQPAADPNESVWENTEPVLRGVKSPPDAAEKRARAAMIGAGVGVFAAILCAVFFFIRPEPRAHLSVVTGADGDMLVVEVHEAAAGEHVRFAGTDSPLVAGKATFPLRAESLHLGDNTFPIDIIAAGGSVHSEDAVLALEYRVRADLAGLANSPASIAVVADVPVGAKLEIDGTDVHVDAKGHASKNFSVDAAHVHGGAIAYDLKYRVELAQGAVHEGTVSARVPYTTLQIDRPGLSLITDKDAVEIAGLADATATVTIDGVAVASDHGRFLERVPLADVKEYSFHVVARSAGKAPHEEVIAVKRVADMNAEAAGFPVDSDLTYAKIEPNPNVYRGRGIAIEGRVYNVDLRAGQSVVQMLAKDCGRGRRCPVWVTYPAATDATVDSWVRVVGRVAGEQQFRAESNQVRTVPRIDAAFVLVRKNGARD